MSAMINEDELVRWLKVKSQLRRKSPTLKGVLIDSGNGPEPYKPPRLGPLSEGDKDVYRRAWRRLSSEDQVTLADYVSESGIVT